MPFTPPNVKDGHIAAKKAAKELLEPSPELWNLKSEVFEIEYVKESFIQKVVRFFRKYLFITGK